MKKFIFSVFLPLLYFLSCLFAPIAKTASAQSTTPTYACICNDTTYFYATKDERRGLFLLPQTYYVKILSVDEPFCKIEYLYDGEYTQKLVGYAKTEELTFVDYVPKTPYLTHLFEVHYSIDGSNDLADDFLDKIVLTCAYYGDYTVGSKRYCYVLRDDSFGYVPKPDDFIYEKNTEYADYLATQKQDPPPLSPEPSENAGMTSAQIAILIVLCLLVPTLTALILKPPKKPPYEEE
ncbi:MAG: hypothetical protein E7381_03015 [Clostridiales bacterium]|nr:hypothetical protein [Clostridiales bacterium]